MGSVSQPVGVAALLRMEATPVKATPRGAAPSTPTTASNPMFQDRVAPDRRVRMDGEAASHSNDLVAATSHPWARTSRVVRGVWRKKGLLHGDVTSLIA